MRRIALGAALLLFAVGCGSSASSTCDDLGNAITGLQSKYSACGTLPLFPFDKNSCVDAYNSGHCSDADKQKITDFVHCLNNMPTCTAGNQASWGNSLEACLSPLETINC